MSFKDLFRKNKKDTLDLIEWQNIIDRSNSNSLRMSKNELVNFTHNMYIPQQYRIIQDCVNLVNDTKTMDVYFYRLNTLIEELIELSKLEKFVSFNSPSPSKQLEEVLSHKEILTQQFLERCWDDTLNSALKLKTEKGRQNTLNKFFQNILQYTEYLAPSNLEYLNRLKKDYELNNT